MRADARNRSAAIEQTRERQVRSGCAPTTKNLAAVISERAVGTPKWQLKSGEGRHFFGTAGLDGARNRRR
jgi:hypothetical protein